MQRPKFATLDGLRGVAAVAVVTRHYQVYFGYDPLPSSHTAVDLFFILSGFVIAHAYGDRMGVTMSSREFIKSRLIRLYPLYIVGVILGLVGAVVIAVRQSGDLLAPLRSAAFALFMLPTPVGDRLFPLNVPAWSLFFEVIVNVAFAALWRHLSTKMLLAITLAGATGIVLARAYCGSLDLGWIWSSALGGLVRVLFGFPAGIILYRAYRAGLRLPELHPALYCLALAVMLMIEPTAGSELLTVLIGYPILVLTAASASPNLERPLVALGGVSYALYALHDPLRPFLAYFFLKVFGSPVDAAPWSGVILVIMALTIAWIAQFADVPLRRWLTKLLARPLQAEPSQ